eukprot:scaffold1538_cov109-Cylindrotheca_fusiformis.AAC.1
MKSFFNGVDTTSYTDMKQCHLERLLDSQNVSNKKPYSSIFQSNDMNEFHWSRNSRILNKPRAFSLDVIYVYVNSIIALLETVPTRHAHAKSS